MNQVWNTFWDRAGRVPIRQKIIGIVVASLLVLGLAIAWWVRHRLGGWLSYLLSEERVAQAMAVGTRGVVIITVLAALVGLVIAWLLTWVLTRPILHLTEVAKFVEYGDLTQRAPIWANDEIGELSRAFNAMIASLFDSQGKLESSNDSLRRRNEELAALYTMARMSSQSFDMQEILKHGLHIGLDVTGADGGAIALTDSSGKHLEIRAQRDLPTALFNLMNAQCEENKLACQVLETGQALLVKTREEDDVVLDSTLRQYCLELGYELFGAVPIKHKGDVYGVMLVTSRQQNAITDQKFVLLSMLCTQLGVAIENSQLWTELKHKENLRARLLAKVVTAQEDERQRISRELHDETGQALTSLQVRLKVLEQSVVDSAVKNEVRDLRQFTAQTSEEIRRLSLDLRPSALDTVGLVATLEWYVDEYQQNAGISVDLNTKGLKERVPFEMETLLYRVVQEALTNAARHSGATNVWVTLRHDSNALYLCVRDNGRGFDIERTLKSQDKGLGLLGMQERIGLVGGQFEMQSTLGEGTQVEVTIPLVHHIDI